MVKNVAESLRLSEGTTINPTPPMFEDLYLLFLKIPDNNAIFCRGSARRRDDEITAEFEHAWLEIDGEIVDPMIPTDDLDYVPEKKLIVRGKDAASEARWEACKKWMQSVGAA
jgi:hypothetical protein